MIEAAGLTNELRTMKNVTILPPTENAFTVLPPDVQIALRSPANRAVLARIVRYSVITQTRTVAQLTPGNYPTAEGTPVNVQSVNGAIRINDATITGPDVKVANGVLHAVDRLLIPPTVDLNTISAKPGTPTPSPTTAIAPTSAAPTPTTSPSATAAPPTSAPSTATATALTVTTVATTSPASTSPASTSPASTSVATTLAPTTVASTIRPPTTTIA